MSTGTLRDASKFLSGMTHEDQMKDSIETFSHFEPLSEEERAAVDEVAERLDKNDGRK